MVHCGAWCEFGSDTVRSDTNRRVIPEVTMKTRIRRNSNTIPEGVVFFNYAYTKATMPAAKDIPTLVSSSIMDALQDGESDPYFKVEAIEYPAKGSGGIYEREFFESFLNVARERPIPGSKRGHEWLSRGSSDFYTVGGKLEPNADGLSGTAFLKIFIPKNGDTTDNAGFIRDAKAGIVHFSLVSNPDWNVKIDPETREEKRHFTASKGYERNDAVEYGSGAMKQVVNSENHTDIAAAKALIAAGKFTLSNVEGEAVIQNGLVCRSVLRRLVSRANETDKVPLSDLISLIDKAKPQGGTSVNKDELFAALKNMVANAQTNIAEIAQAVGLGSLIRNEADIANEAMVKTLNSKLGDKPIEKVDAILAENAANAAAMVENAISAIAGTKLEKNASGQDVENPAFRYAFTVCNGKSGAELSSAIEGLKTDHVMLALNAQRADGESRLNRSSAGGKSGASETGDGIPTIRIGRA